MMCGAHAAHVVGHWRGQYAFVQAWVSWQARNRRTPDFKNVEVDDCFQQLHRLEPSV